MIDAEMRAANRETEIILLVTRINGNLQEAIDKLQQEPESDISDLLRTINNQYASLRTNIQQKRSHERNACDRFKRNGGNDHALA